MDITQIILAISVSLITVTLVIIGYYVAQLLRELKNTLIKTNLILDDTRSITASVAKPVSTFSEFVMGFKNGFKVFNKFFPKEKGD